MGLVLDVGRKAPHAQIGLYHEIDELILKINPVTARAGIPLFTGKYEPSRRRFTRPEHVTLDSGVTFLTYTADEVSP